MQCIRRCPSVHINFRFAGDPTGIQNPPPKDSMSASAMMHARIP
jgi:hypothetical protein